MKIRSHAIILMGISMWLLACRAVDRPTEPSSPTLLPSQTPTTAPSLTPMAAPTATPIATAAAPPASTATASPIPAGVDPTQKDIPYSARPAWRMLLGWPDECEEAFQRFTQGAENSGGITVYPLGDEQYLVVVLCNLGPYWEEDRAYWLNNHASPPAAQLLTMPVLSDGDAPERGLTETDVLYGAFPINYDPNTQTLTSLHAHRGLRDCGVFYKYHLQDARFVLDEVRYRGCDDPIEDDKSPLNADEWPLVYPSTAAVDHIGPFYKVIPVPHDLQGQIMRLEAVSNGDLRLLTTDGFALLHDGAWQPYFLAPEQRFMGVDKTGRLWFLPEEAPYTIFYWDSALADYGGSAFVRADAGWLPVDDPAALEGQGVLTDDQGQVWLVTEQDVRVYADGRWTIFTRDTLGMRTVSDPDLRLDFTLTFAAGQQRIWVGECDWGELWPKGGGGVRWLNTAEFAAGEFSWAGAQASTSQGCVMTIAADAEGNVWIGSDYGMAARINLAKKSWQQFPLPSPADYQRGYPVALSIGPDGAPWLLSALCTGVSCELRGLCGDVSCDAMRALYHFQDGTWVEVMGLQDYAEKLYQGPTLPVLFDAAGTPWFFLGGTPFRIADNHLEPSPVAGLNVLDATVDAAGQLWLVAQAGDNPPALWVLEVSTD